MCTEGEIRDGREFSTLLGGIADLHGASLFVYCLHRSGEDLPAECAQAIDIQR